MMNRAGHRCLWFGSRWLSARAAARPEMSYPTTWRTHSCGQVQVAGVCPGEQVVLTGWLDRVRNQGRFVEIRDGHGTVQVYLNDEQHLKVARTAPTESVIRLTGVLAARPPAQVNPARRTGAVEVTDVSEFALFNQASETLPVYPRDTPDPGNPLLLRYRHLALRRWSLHRILRCRSHFLHLCRRILLEDEGFTEVETPSLQRRTPGGAREFLVPTADGRCYSLAQSPQVMKQLLVMGGVDRYLQVARCYRDEDSKPDRQPEFTQLDLEMGFAGEEDVMQVVERLVSGVWPRLLEFSRQLGDPKPPSGSAWDAPPLLKLAHDAPFPRMTHAEALRRYGTDKPDTRFPVELEDVEIWGKEYVLFRIPKPLSKLTTTKYLRKYLLEDETLMNLRPRLTIKMEGMPTPYGGVAMMTVRAHKQHRLAMGKALKMTAEHLEHERTHFFKNRRQNKIQVYSPGLHFLWIHDFPLFEEKNGGLVSAHHPFTAPRQTGDELDGLMEDDPLKITGRHFDLVCNGCEVGGGSERVHSPELQRRLFNKLNVYHSPGAVHASEDGCLEYLVEALEHGAPPHAGIALGVDRLMTLLTGTQSLREVMAFPKNNQRDDPQCKAPAHVTSQELAEYGLQHVTES